MTQASGRPRVAFYAPMKSPDDPVPSGDRTVARLYMAALEKAGFMVEIASDLRVYDGKGDPAAQQALVLAAGREAARLKQAWAAGAPQPDLWFTYHVYHKSPDFLGPDLAASLGIPYCISEVSHAPKRRGGPWAAFLAATERAMAQADRLFVVTAADLECVEKCAVSGEIVRLSPFIDTESWPVPGMREEAATCRLVTVAMMRPGDKVTSFEILAKILKNIEKESWTLTIVGDGPARAEVVSLFAGFGGRVTFAGAVQDRTKMAQILENSDVFVWPAVNEAYGMALLEAQVMGLPVLAGDEGGVSEVVLHEKAGFLAKKRDIPDFSGKLMRLIADPALRQRMGAAARAFVLRERSLSNAASVLNKALVPLIKRDRT